MDAVRLRAGVISSVLAVLCLAFAVNAFAQGGGSSVVSGTVVKFNPFGAFVKLDENIQGLSHISEFGSEVSMKELLTLGGIHQFKVLSVDPREHRLALGPIKDEPRPEETPTAEPTVSLEVPQE